MKVKTQTDALHRVVQLSFINSAASLWFLFELSGLKFSILVFALDVPGFMQFLRILCALLNILTGVLRFRCLGFVCCPASKRLSFIMQGPSVVCNPNFG